MENTDEKELIKIIEKEIKKEQEIKLKYKKLLKDLINVTGLYKWLDEGWYWSPEGLVEIKLTDEKRSGYLNYQHARIINDKDKLLYVKHSFDKYEKPRNIDHYYVWQSVGYLGDDYSGYLLFPLKNGKYFKISYSC